MLRTSQKPIKVEEGIRSVYKVRIENDSREIQAFTYCVTDRSPNLTLSRKWGTYAISNILFQAYFYLNATNLCANIARALKASDLPPLTSFPISQQVTFRFYRGVLNFLEEKYAEAMEDLDFAFKKSPKGSENKR